MPLHLARANLLAQRQSTTPDINRSLFHDLALGLADHFDDGAEVLVDVVGGELGVNFRGMAARRCRPEPVDVTASMARSRSLFISAVAKPGVKSLFAGDVGTRPGTGQLV